MTIPNIIQKYRQENGKPLSYRRFADELNAVTGQVMTISHQTVRNWETGVHEPDGGYLTVLKLLSKPGSWQNTFAHEISETTNGETEPTAA